MKIDITYDNKFLVCQSEQPEENTILKNALTRELQDAWILKKSKPHINTERCFINSYGMVPIGLWLDVINICKEFNIPFVLSENTIKYISQFDLDKEDFTNYIKTTFDNSTKPSKNANEPGTPFVPRPYQIDAAYALLKYRFASGEISTSGGKTLISFMIFRYLIDKCNIKKILYIVPSVDLANQSSNDYNEYETYLMDKNQTEWSTGVLRSGLKKAEKEAIDNCTILFGTFQSLCKKSLEFFQEFEAVMVDEAHHLASSNSMKNIINKCTNLKYAISFTGTFPRKETIGYYNIQSYIGPLVYKLSANDLINQQKSATPIYTIFEIMDWCDNENKDLLYQMRKAKQLAQNRNDITFGAKLLRQEADFINSAYIRMKYIGDMAIKMAKNTLILFGDIKGGYGKRLYEYINENSDKNVYYVDGYTPNKNREYYKQQCENDTEGKTVLVASIGTFGEGIDIKNIWSIFLVNSAKSERLVRQICGRGLRQYPGKDKTVLYDFVDDLRVKRDDSYGDNYMWKHYKERRKIYLEQKFPVYEQKVKFQRENSLL